MSKNRDPKILVVDDDSENLWAMEVAMENLDIQVVTAETGQEAFSLMMRHDFAFVMLDVDMPEMDGYETAAMMKDIDRTRHLPVIFMTDGNKQKKYAFEGFDEGAVDYLSKPIDPDVLRAKVGIFLRLHRQEADLKIEITKRQDVERNLEEVQEELRLATSQ